MKEYHTSVCSVAFVTGCYNRKVYLLQVIFTEELFTCVGMIIMLVHMKFELFITQNYLMEKVQRPFKFSNSVLNSIDNAIYLARTSNMSYFLGYCFLIMENIDWFNGTVCAFKFSQALLHSIINLWSDFILYKSQDEIQINHPKYSQLVHSVDIKEDVEKLKGMGACSLF